MIKRLGLPLRVKLTPTDKLQLGDPSKVDGWRITHVSSMVCLVVILYDFMLNNYINSKHIIKYTRTHT